MKINSIYLIGSLSALCIAILTLTGRIQTVIYFKDPINEMAFCLVSLIMFIMLLVASFERNPDKN